MQVSQLRTGGKTAASAEAKRITIGESGSVNVSAGAKNIVVKKKPSVTAIDARIAAGNDLWRVQNQDSAQPNSTVGTKCL
jgi:hypothetical protein